MKKRQHIWGFCSVVTYSFCNIEKGWWCYVTMYYFCHFEKQTTYNVWNEWLCHCLRLDEARIAVMMQKRFFCYTKTSLVLFQNRMRSCVIFFFMSIKYWTYLTYVVRGVSILQLKWVYLTEYRVSNGSWCSVQVLEAERHKCRFLVSNGTSGVLVKFFSHSITILVPF